MDDRPILMDRHPSLMMQLLPIDTCHIDWPFVLLINVTLEKNIRFSFYGDNRSMNLLANLGSAHELD